MSQATLLSQLERMEGYLRQDPKNPELLADTFDVALRAADWERAEFHLHHARSLGLDRRSWMLREAHWLLAQHRWAEARNSLSELQEEAEPASAYAATLAADLAYVDLRQGNFASGITRLEVIVEGVAPAAAFDPRIELVWLQLLHRATDLERAMAWLQRREAEGALLPAVAGVGSLIALDHGDYEASLRWAITALREEQPVVEAQVARASLALAEQNATQALDLLRAALIRNGDDGRVWSAIGFAELLEQNLPSARTAFDRAVLLLPTHIGTWHGLGWAALAQSDLPGAHSAFDAAIALDRNFGESHGGAAVVYAFEGQVEDARNAIAIALRLDRTSLSARYAEALLAGDARDATSLMRLASRLLGGKRTPLGLDVLDLLRNSRP